MPLPPRPRAPLVALLLLLTVAVGPGGSGCRRAARPDLGQDRTVEAGVPVELGSREEGAAAVTWELGDDTAPQKAARLSHAFSRPGTYTVRALDEGEEVGRVQLTVVPRPVLRAVPATAQTVLWVPQLRGHVEPLVDFYERLIGPENARRTLEEAPLVSLMLRGVTGGSTVVDPEEGFGFFLLPEFDGVVALLGVTEPAAAMEAVSKELRDAGHQVRPQADGSARVMPSEGGSPMLLFEDRGYLYLAVPENPEEPEEGQVARAQLAVTPDVEVARRAVKALTGPGLSEDALLGELRGKVAEGSVYLYSGARPEPMEQGEEEGPVRGFFASLAARPERLDLDGFLASTRPLLQGGSAPASALLEQAALGPLAAAQLSVPPEELAKLAFGSPGSPRRERTLERWRQQGLDAEPLLKALRGDVGMLVYFDAPAFFRKFIQDKRPEPRGTVVVEAGLTSSEPVLRLLERQLQDTSLRFTTQKLPDGVVYRTRLREQPVELRITSQRATLLAGEVLEGRPRGDVGAALRQRFGGEAFGAGHVSVMVDLGQLRADLSAPESVPGVPQGQLAAAQAFTGALLDQLTPLDSAFLDFSQAEGGARLKGRVSLRSEREVSR
ncbi:PKD domain-containing protein [Pyxidicoccus fallax]|uniref:PKD domain-containing protein n=1 Tax=Pyxidicoccus fallax TaxID=394095 RepID=A0A848LSP9_9BACT|nr:PKD domain-containing protein [Pyxidicoccus fallax]NMO20965.1 PKD domain-containing protein [Pyxidicoccus fallax]NPC82081.1 PKD domain-containing protein [Pyxidicoccus fallax]